MPVTDDATSTLERRHFDTAFLEALDRVRDELRDEVQRSEGRVMTAVQQVQARLEQSETTHAGIHAAEGESRQIAHARFEDFMHRAELAAARRDGALGIIRFVFDLVGRNWRGIVAAGGATWVLLGGVHVQVVAS
jgi:hypothetical protein